MPPPTKTKTPSVEWWRQRNAYVFNDDIHVQYELQFGRDLIKPGDSIRVKNMRGTYKFRCFANNIVTGAEWFDCMDNTNGSWHSFPMDKLKCLVKPKRSRKRKPNT